MNAPLRQYSTLSEAVQKHTPSQHPDRDRTKIINHFAKKFPSATHAVLFVNLDFGSSHLGDWTVMVVGPGQTYSSLAEVEGSHLHDLPSMRQYPVAYVELKGT